MNERIVELAKYLVNFIIDLKTRFPESEFIVDQAETATGSSWINIVGKSIAIEHKPGTGFGLFLSDEEGYGSRPDEIYRDTELLFKRLGQLLSVQNVTPDKPAIPEDEHERCKMTDAAGNSGPLAQADRKQITLKDIREILGITQADVAKALGKQQSAISKIEKRDDVLISTLVSLIHGMNGAVEIKARFDGCDVCIYSDGDILSSATTEAVEI